MAELRILIADDHPLVRQGLRTTLEAQAGWTICAEAATGREAVARALELKPDLVITDISMPELNGLEATRQIRRDLPETEILILTMHESEPLVAEALKAGARGYLLKSDTQRLLVAAVETIARHKPFLTGTVSEMVMGGLLQRGADHQAEEASRLSPREREIVQLIAEGRSNKEVATRLGISVKTVDAHRTNIMRRLNLHSVAELVRYAIREKIIEA